jgi:hypothetical protein
MRLTYIAILHNFLTSALKEMRQRIPDMSPEEYDSYREKVFKLHAVSLAT